MKTLNQQCCSKVRIIGRLNLFSLSPLTSLNGLCFVLKCPLNVPADFSFLTYIRFSSMTYKHTLVCIYTHVHIFLCSLSYEFIKSDHNFLATVRWWESSFICHLRQKIKQISWQNHAVTKKYIC